VRRQPALLLQRRPLSVVQACRHHRPVQPPGRFHVHGRRVGSARPEREGERTMCYDATAKPPLPPIAGGAATAFGRETILTADDGNNFAAFTATHDRPGGPGMVVLPDVRGLHAFYQELALRFAEAGVHATAFDYFG